MTTPSKADVLLAARGCGFDLHWHRDGKLDINMGQLERFAAAMYAAGIESAKFEGWRQCAVGQHTSQFCGQLEVEKAKAYAKGAEDMRERAARICETYTDPTRPASCSGYAFWHAKPIRALPITPTNTEGEQG